MVVISFVLTGLLSFKFIAHVRNNPIVFYIEEKQARVSDINFPAITICPGLVLAKSNFVRLDYDQIVDNLRRNRGSLGNLSENE
jgi:hypothetical protein